MKRFYGLFFIAFFIPLLLLAQGNYKPGYVITSKGDTLQGYINYRSWNKNPNDIEFKRTLADTSGETLSVNNIRAFIIPSYEQYERFVLAISQDETGILNLKQGLDTSKITSAVFLKVMIKGKNLILYSYQDRLKQRYFIAESHVLPVELIFRRYLNPYKPSETITQESYKRQLQSEAYKYQPQNQSLLHEIQTIDYANADIEKIVLEINGSEKNIDFSASEKYGSRIFIGFGVSHVSVSDYAPFDVFFPPGINSNTKLDVHNSLTTELSLGGDIFLNRNKRSLIFRTELHLSASINNKVSINRPDTLLETYKYYSIALNPQILYNLLNSEALKIYVSAGAEVIIGGWNRTTYTETGNNYSISPPTYNEFATIFTTRTGIVINNKFDFFMGYDPFSTRKDQAKLTELHAGINYFFGRNK